MEESRWRPKREWLFKAPHVARSPESAEAAEQAALEIVDLALRATGLALRAGALTSEATAVALTIGAAYQLPIDVDVTWSSITIGYHRVGSADPITGFRAVRRRVTNYSQLTRLMLLVDHIGEGKLTLEQARERLAAISADPRPYRGWVILLGQALVGASVAGLLGGRPPEIALAGLASGLLYAVQNVLARTSLSSFFLQAFGAAVPTAMGIAIMQVRAGQSGIFYEVSPALIVASGIVSLLAGIGIVGAAREGMEGNLISSSARTLEAVLQTAGIVVGVTVTLWVGLALGVEGNIAPTVGLASPSWWLVLWAALICVGVAFGLHLGPRALPFSALLGGLGFAIFQWSLPVLGNQPAATALASLVIGVMAQLVAGRWRFPLVALVTTAVACMMPGRALYHGLYEAITAQKGVLPATAQLQLGQAIMIAFALAAGTTLGAQVARSWGLPSAKLFRYAMLKALRRSGSKPANTQTAGRL